MAAPYVSGALGLATESLPYLNGSQLIDTVLTTANTNFANNKMEVVLEKDNEKIKTINIIYIDQAKRNSNEIKVDFKEWLGKRNNWKIFFEDDEINNLISSDISLKYFQLDNCNVVLEHSTTEKNGINVIDNHGIYTASSASLPFLINSINVSEKRTKQVVIRT